MKTILLKSITMAVLLHVTATAAWGQQTQKPQPEPTTSEAKQGLSRFSLNFEGGTPQELIARMEKALGKPVNAIIPEDLRDVQIPSFNVKNVTTPELFEAIEMASRKNGIAQAPGLGRASVSVTVMYGFNTPDNIPDDKSIWYFYHSPAPDALVAQHATNGAPQGQRMVQFFQLEPYLEKYKIQDITTAITTGWRMLGVVGTPELKFHEETKLLIGVGNPEQIMVIHEVLGKLGPGTQSVPHGLKVLPSSPKHP